MKKSIPAQNTPVLKQFAGLWTMWDHPSKAKEWTLEQKFREAKRAGFDGVGGGALPEAAAFCEKYGLDYICYVNADAKSFAENLKAGVATRPARINAQVCDHDTLPKEAVRVWLKLEALAEKAGVPIDLEVHRDTCTETPEKTYEIADLYRKATGREINFCWDFSHLAVVKHLNPPYAERLLLRPKLIQRARQIHLRPFNGHHAQIPATDGKGKATAEFGLYLDFVDALLGCWMDGAKGGEVLYVSPEFGPVPSGYGLSSFANVWKDAIHLRGRTESIWKAKLKAHSGRPSAS